MAREPRLLRAHTGTIHVLREDGKTACGRDLGGDVGAEWTTEDVKGQCYSCSWHGIKTLRPRTKCAECGYLIPVTQSWLHRRHEHYVFEEGTE